MEEGNWKLVDLFRCLNELAPDCADFVPRVESEWKSRSLPERRGVTVFLSSHLLSEIEQVATHLAIISQGRLMFEGTREELHRRSKPAIIVEVDQPERAYALLSRLGRTVARDGNSLKIMPDGDCDPAEINSLLVKEGVAVSRLTAQHPTLEDFFLELTGSSVPEKECVAR